MRVICLMMHATRPNEKSEQSPRVKYLSTYCAPIVLRDVRARLRLRCRAYIYAFFNNFDDMRGKAARLRIMSASLVLMTLDMPITTAK